MSGLLTVLGLILFAAASPFAGAVEQERPNILWITAEDMSPALGCYGDTFATTPNLDNLAKESVVYDNAFATAPVCSPSRSCIINGLYATTQGTQQMRSAFPIPDYMTGFPSFMREEGYYTSNNVKTDYNSGNFTDIIKASWNESSGTAHWRKRSDGQNFMSVFNLMTSHQSRTMVWPYEKFKSDVQSKLSADEIHDPAKVPLPPYYVDTPVVRKTVARAYDCVTAMDKEVGTLLKQLEDDGLADNTIVFFYSDHGNGMPRHKRALLDSGMKVALMVRFPKKYQHLAPGTPGTRTDQLVSFVDFAPTALSLAGVAPPKYMEGRAFLGGEALRHQPRQYVFGHRDRVDEVLDLARSVRDKRFLYIRNFMPHLGYNQPTAWPDLGEIRHEFYRLTERELMTKPQWHFAGPTRVHEELYDCDADPQNLKNLIGDPKYRKDARRLRDALFNNIRETKDLGFLPEAHAWDITKGTTPWDLARDPDSDYHQAPLVAAATAVGIASEDLTARYLTHVDAGVRFWGAVGFSARQSVSKKGIDALVVALKDESASVRVEAANALCRHGHADKGLPVLIKALEHDNLSVVQHAARQIEMLGKVAQSAVSAMKKCDDRMKVIRPPGTSPVVVQPDKDMAMFIGFSTNAFLKKYE
jgi:arylsulfatase A-like enzyme